MWGSQSVRELARAREPLNDSEGQTEEGQKKPSIASWIAGELR